MSSLPQSSLAARAFARSGLRPRPSRFYRGQYFSIDAIIASVIFVLALSLLASHWFALRAQNESQSSYLQEDASRLSETLLQAPDPADWYAHPGTANTSGFGLVGAPRGVLNYTTLIQAAASLDAASGGALYDQARGLMATPADFYITLNTSMPDAGAHPADQLAPLAIGRAPAHATQLVRTSRGVVIPLATSAGTVYDHYGIFTLTLWTNRSS